ncbi:Flavin reductase [Rhodovulum sp. P5]|uniref:NAD(P)-dependent oxidoreductase n=1 Tax=Rhodovulum sp. P5 TaxID=1564506 RepID=UPI0009C258DB|nr:SDR family oxidoreductase [Rhodovulum sp. P5]ARE41417.1 Flavin reductase [Rhodovulum sp. P5]
MKLLVVGASKGIGFETVTYALERGHEVRALARSADKMALDHSRLDKIAGDARNPEDIAAAVTGVDAAIMTIGLPKNMETLKRTTLFSDATRVLLTAMSGAGVKRLLVVTGFGAGDSKAKFSFVEKLPFDALLGRAYADKTVQEELIMASDLDWTIARPGILFSRPMTGEYEVLVKPETWHQGLMSRANVAHFLIHAAEDGTYVHQTPVLIR